VWSFSFQTWSNPEISSESRNSLHITCSESNTPYIDTSSFGPGSNERRFPGCIMLCMVMRDMDRTAIWLSSAGNATLDPYSASLGPTSSCIPQFKVGRLSWFSFCSHNLSGREECNDFCYICIILSDRLIALKILQIPHPDISINKSFWPSRDGQIPVIRQVVRSSVSKILFERILENLHIFTLSSCVTNIWLVSSG